MLRGLARRRNALDRIATAAELLAEVDKKTRAGERWVTRQAATAVLRRLVRTGEVDRHEVTVSGRHVFGYSLHGSVTRAEILSASSGGVS